VVTEAIEWAVDPNGDNDMSDQMDVINLTGFNPPPLASFTGSKSRFGFSRSVFETCFFLFIFRLPFCCCEPHLNRPSAHSLDFYYHGARHTKKKSILASWIFD
jgi:hypothetical protein